jgi:septal ring-binding cell division protein DamX
MHPIAFGIGNFCQVTSQSNITTNPVKKDPIKDPKVANKLAKEAAAEEEEVEEAKDDNFK